MDRQSVYAEIDREREYQETCAKACDWEPQDHEHKPPESFLVYMNQYLDKAAKAVLLSTNMNRAEVLANIRKVVALGVACLEFHGCPQRDPKDVDKRKDNIRRIA